MADTENEATAAQPTNTVQKKVVKKALRVSTVRPNAPNPQAVANPGAPKPAQAAPTNKPSLEEEPPLPDEDEDTRKKEAQIAKAVAQSNPAMAANPTANTQASPSADADTSKPAQSALFRSSRFDEVGLVDEATKRKTGKEIFMDQLHDFIKSIWFKILVILIILGIGLKIAWDKLPVLAQNKLPEILAESGIKLGNFEVVSVSYHDLVLSKVSDAKKTMNASKVTARFDFKDLLQNNRLKSLTIEGLNLTGVRRDDGISLGPVGELITSSKKASSAKPVSIPSININNSKFTLKRETNFPKKDENDQVIDETVKFGFSAKGSLIGSNLNLTITTDYDTETSKLTTETNLKKTSDSAEIKMEITQGDLIKEGKVIGSVKGLTEVSVIKGVLTKGNTDLTIQSDAGKLAIRGETVPHDGKFDINLTINRSFEDLEKSAGKFTGAILFTIKDMEMSGTQQHFKGHIPYEFFSEKLSNGSTEFDKLSMKQDAYIECETSKCVIKMSNPMDISFDKMIMKTQFRLINIFKPVSFKINPDEKEPFLKTDGGNLDFNIPIPGVSINAMITDALSNIAVAGAFNNNKINVKTNLFSPGHTGTVTISNGAIATKDFTIRGIAAALEINDKTWPSGRFNIAQFIPNEKEKYAEMAMQFSLKPTRMNEYQIQSRIAMVNGAVNFTLDGTYSLITHQWDMYFNLPKTAINGQEVTISKVLPLLSSHLDDNTKATITAKGRISVNEDRIKGPLNMMIENGSANWKNIQFDGINSVMQISQLVPFATPEDQKFFVSHINFGIPLNKMLFNYQVIPSQEVRFSSISGKFLGANIKNIKTFSYPFGKPPADMLYEISNLDLSEFTENLISNNLQADGTATMTWKIGFTDKGLAMNELTAASKLPGTIHFNPDDATKAAMDPNTLNLLKETMVSKFALKGKGNMNENASFKLRLEGHTPLNTTNDRIELNFNYPFKKMFKPDNRLVDIDSDVLLMMNNAK